MSAVLPETRYTAEEYLTLERSLSQIYDKVLNDDWEAAGLILS